MPPEDTPARPFDSGLFEHKLGTRVAANLPDPDDPGDCMIVYLSTALIYASAALAEIAGCFAFWAWLRMDRSAWWLLPGIAALVSFACLLTLAPSDNAGRAYAAYGGIYIAASVLWLWLAEGQQPDKWDLLGSGLAVSAAGIILFGPRT